MGDDRTTRRQLLVGATGLGVGLVTAAVGDPEVGRQPRRTRPGESAALPDDDRPYALWQYRPTLRGNYARTLPINLVSPLEAANLADVRAVFRGAGWSAWPSEKVRYAWNPETAQYVTPQWTGAETRYGVGGRLHVRCWVLAGHLSIQAHVDTPPTPGHRIQSFEAARSAVEQLFAGAGWTVHPGRLAFDNEQAPDHDGSVTVLER